MAKLPGFQQFRRPVVPGEAILTRTGYALGAPTWPLSTQEVLVDDVGRIFMRLEVVLFDPEA
jgi:hypothetical protein